VSLKKALIIGQGSIGEKHRKVAENNEQVGLVISLGQREFSSSVIDKTDSEVTDYIEAVASGLPDFAIVAGPASTHIATAKALLNAGIPVMIEKPLSHCSSRLSCFQEFVDNSGHLVSVGYNLRHSESINAFKRFIDSGELGNVFSVRCEVGQYLPDWRPNTDYRESVSANASLGGGVLLELSHEIDYLQWIFGQIESVSGVVGRFSSLQTDVEDTAQVVMKFGTDKRPSQLIASLNMDFIRRDTTRCCYAICDAGTLKWDGVADEVSVFRASDKKWTPIFSNTATKLATYEKALSQFITDIDSQTHSGVTVAEGVSVMRVIDAVRKSSLSEQSETVTLPSCG